MADENILNPSDIPETQDVFDFFREFLLKWSGLLAERVEAGDDDIPSLPLELGLMFTDPCVGILVIRASDGLETLLALSPTGKARESKLGFFTEVVILFWNRFVSKFWGMDSRKLAQALFKKSHPLDWPRRKPDVAITVFIGQELLEIRLWSPISDWEMDTWKTARK